MRPREPDIAATPTSGATMVVPGAAAWPAAPAAEEIAGAAAAEGSARLAAQEEATALAARAAAAPAGATSDAFRVSLRAPPGAEANELASGGRAAAPAAHRPDAIEPKTIGLDAVVPAASARNLAPGRDAWDLADPGRFRRVARSSTWRSHPRALCHRLRSHVVIAPYQHVRQFRSLTFRLCC